MSSFSDMMHDDGYSNPDEYMEHLENEAMDEMASANTGALQSEYDGIADVRDWERKMRLFLDDLLHSDGVHDIVTGTVGRREVECDLRLKVRADTGFLVSPGQWLKSEEWKNHARCGCQLCTSNEQGHFIEAADNAGGDIERCGCESCIPQESGLGDSWKEINGVALEYNGKRSTRWCACGYRDNAPEYYLADFIVVFDEKQQRVRIVDQLPSAPFCFPESVLRQPGLYAGADEWLISRDSSDPLAVAHREVCETHYRWLALHTITWLVDNGYAALLSAQGGARQYRIADFNKRIRLQGGYSISIGRWFTFLRIRENTDLLNVQIESRYAHDSQTIIVSLEPGNSLGLLADQAREKRAFLQKLYLDAGHGNAFSTLDRTLVEREYVSYVSTLVLTCVNRNKNVLAAMA